MSSESLWIEYPKFLLRDLKSAQKINDTKWAFDFKGTFESKEFNKRINFSCVHIQGIIDQRPCDDVMLIRDSTGKAKLTNCSTAVDNSAKLTQGAYCSVSGVFVREKGLPEISAQKISFLCSKEDEKMLHINFWPLEVKDFYLFMLGLMKPDLGIRK